jgi:hypothetical protein
VVFDRVRFGLGYQMTDGSVASSYNPRKTRLHCPCGEFLQAGTTDELVSVARSHLEKEHPDLSVKYSDADILWLAH